MVVLIFAILFICFLLKRNKKIFAVFQTEEYNAFERLLELNGYSKTNFKDNRWIVETKSELRYSTFNEYLYVYNKKTKKGVITDEDFDGCCSTGDVMSKFRYDDVNKCMVGQKK